MIASTSSPAPLLHASVSAQPIATTTKIMVSEEPCVDVGQTLFISQSPGPKLNTIM